MKRRNLIAGLGSTSLPFAALAQSGSKPRSVIGFLGATSPEALGSSLIAFRQGLAETGRIEGRTVTIEYRWAEGRYDRLTALARDLLQIDPTVIVAATLPAALAAKGATTTKPIVFFSGGDPVEQGLVASLNRPGGNLTGACVFINDLAPKQLELLREAMPRAVVIGFLANPSNPNSSAQLKELEAAASAAGQRIISLQARTAADIEGEITTLAKQQGEALIVAADPFLGIHYEQTVALAAKHRIAVVSGRLVPKAGGLIGYGNKLEDAYWQVGQYTGRILAGEKPGDLPIVRATRFELVVNLKAAKALGLVIPPALLARADEVIE